MCIRDLHSVVWPREESEDSRTGGRADGRTDERARNVQQEYEAKRMPTKAPFGVHLKSIWGRFGGAKVLRKGLEKDPQKDSKRTPKGLL